VVGLLDELLEDEEDVLESVLLEDEEEEDLDALEVLVLEAALELLEPDVDEAEEGRPVPLD
jgi:hypothetical protein